MLAHKGDILFGRYWGAFEAVPFLHFELCYYAPIAWAIDKGFSRYDPGMSVLSVMSSDMLASS